MKKYFCIGLLMSAVCMYASATDISLQPTNSGLRQATANAIEDDVYHLTDVNSWDKLEFDKVFGFLGINSTKGSDIAAGFHPSFSDGDLISVNWSGNLWTDQSAPFAGTGVKDTEGNVVNGRYNHLGAMYGFQNMAIRLYSTSHKADSYTHTLGTLTEYEHNVYGAKFGMNFDEPPVYFNVYAQYANAKSDEDYKLSEPAFGAEVWYVFTESELLTVKAGGNYDGEFTTEDVGEEIKTTTNTLGAQLKLQWKPEERLTYGLHAVMPFSFCSYKNDVSGENRDWTHFYLLLRNGISIALSSEKILFNAGVEITFPYIGSGDISPKNGEYENAYYTGFSFYLTEKLRLDACTEITTLVDNGVSADDLWKQKFRLSLSGYY